MNFIIDHRNHGLPEPWRNRFTSIRIQYQQKRYNSNKTYSKTCQRIMKMKSVDVNSGTYIDYGVKHNEKDCKFKFGDQVRILK